VFKLLIDYIL